MSAGGCEEELGRFYRKLRGKRKAHGVAIVAVARKLVLRLYRMLRERKDYEEFRRQGRDADVLGLPGVRRGGQPHRVRDGGVRRFGPGAGRKKACSRASKMPACNWYTDREKMYADVE